MRKVLLVGIGYVAGYVIHSKKDRIADALADGIASVVLGKKEPVENAIFTKPYRRIKYSA